MFSENGGPQGALGAGLIVGGLTTVVIGWLSQRGARSARKTLLRTMDASMQERFGVCRDTERRLVECR